MAGTCVVVPQDLPRVKSDQVLMTQAADGKTRLIASGPLRTLVSDAPLTPGAQSDWPSTWDTVDTTLHKPDNLAAEIDITATGYARNPAGQEVIAGYRHGTLNGQTVSGSGGVWVIAREPDGTRHPPTALVGSAAANNAFPVLRVDSAGVIYVFIIISLNRLRHFWQSEHGDWVSRPVSFQAGTVAQKVNTYRTAVTVMDGQANAPAAMVQVSVGADAEAEVEVNGKSHTIGGGETAGPFETSVLGQLNVSQIIETSLGTPALSFSAVGSDDKVFDGSDDELGELRNGLQLAAGMMTNGYHSPASVPAAYQRTRKTRGVWFSDHPLTAENYNPKGQISAPRPFQMDLGSGTPVFSLIEPEEARKRHATALAQRDDTIGALRLQGIFDLGWGEVWSDIRSGVATVKTLVVDGATATMTFLIDGVEMLLDFVLETLAQAWDFVSTILDWFGTAWGTVLG